jgi:hypothetical protein
MSLNYVTGEYIGTVGCASKSDALRPAFKQVLNGRDSDDGIQNLRITLAMGITESVALRIAD